MACKRRIHAIEHRMKNQMSLSTHTLLELDARALKEKE